MYSSIAGCNAGLEDFPRATLRMRTRKSLALCQPSYILPSILLLYVGLNLASICVNMGGSRG